jgi:multiple sugar transport system ATP-binding protein
VQQVDTPMALYGKPANLFVATFLGSPGMSILRGTLRRDGAHPTFELAADAAGAPAGPIPLAAASKIPDGWLGSEVLLGIRPESLRPATTDEPGFEAHVDAVEPVGNEAFVYVRVAGQPLVLRGPPRDLPEPGTLWRLAAPGPELHWFDPASGGRLGD